jgi:hypothetical protein
VLGGVDDDKNMVAQQGWFRRCFNMLIALNDLIVTAGLDGIILVDNDVIMKEIQKKGKSGPDLMAEIDKKIIEKLYPAFGITVLDGKDLDWSQLKEPIGLHNLEKKPPVIVPCYASGPCWNPLFCWEKVREDEKEKEKLISFLRDDLKLTWAKNKNATIRKTKDNNNTITIVNGNGNDSAEMVISDDKTKATVKIDDKSKGLKVRAEDGGLNIYKSTITDLIEEALNNGKLTPCEDLEKAERVFVYVRCITNEKEVRDALATAFGVSENDRYKDIAILKDYLFCWDDVKKGNYEELKSSLRNVCEIEWVDTAVLKRDQNEDKLELNNDSNENEKIIIEIRERELFNWDDVLQKNDGELKKCLEDCKIEVDSISISDDKKTIIISKNTNRVATITLIEDENKATLEWDNKGTKEKRELKVKKEKEKGKKEKRKIYTPPEAELFTGKYLFNWDDVLQKNDDELKEYLEDCKIEFEEIKSEDKTITISKGQQVIATITLNEEENIATFEWNKEKRDLKVKDQGIYDYLRKGGNKKVENPELKVEMVKGKRTVEDKRYVYLGKCQTTRTWITDNLKKDIVVFESQEIGSFWQDDKKTNEVLILLFNPNVKQALRNRLLEAKNFVDLLDAFKDEIEEQAKKSSEYKIEIAKNIDFNGPKLSEIVNKFSEATKGITKEDNRPKSQAIDFLFPKELYDKNKGIYEVMVKILDRLKEEVLSIPDEDKDGDWWPIFKNEIFNIISTSGKRDEVILSAIEALNDQDKFNKLVGKRVYDTYFQTFKRQYFKYDTRYLYRPGVGEPILSDVAERELPKELKNELDNREERIEVEDLKDLMKSYTSVMSARGTRDDKELSYPAMLAVAGLYAEWEQVGTWKFENNNFVLDGNKDKIIKLFKKNGADNPNNFEDYVFSKESTKTTIPGKGNLLIIDADKEDATLVIRKADTDLLTELTNEEVPGTEIPQKLEQMFKGLGREKVNNAYYNVTGKMLEPIPEARTNDKLYCCYYIRQNAGTYSIDGDKILKLKVKKEEGNDGKTLKIYEKRE